MKKITLGILIVAALALAYYTISPLFRNIEVNDELPENIEVENTPIIDKEIVQSGFEDLSADKQAEMLKIMDEVNSVEVSKVDEVMPTVNQIEIEDAQPLADISYPVMGTPGHKAEGIVRVIKTAEGVVLRYENFKTINGPNLHVYLAKDLKAKDFIDLGIIKGTSGNINYTVPKGVDLSEYRYVMHWCVPFRVLFNYAEIN